MHDKSIGHCSRLNVVQFLLEKTELKVVPQGQSMELRQLASRDCQAFADDRLWKLHYVGNG